MKNIGNPFIHSRKNVDDFWLKFWDLSGAEDVNIIDLVKSFPTSIYLQKSASIQPRTSPSKFGGKFNSLFCCLLSPRRPAPPQPQPQQRAALQNPDHIKGLAKPGKVYRARSRKCQNQNQKSFGFRKERKPRCVRETKSSPNPYRSRFWQVNSKYY